MKLWLLRHARVKLASGICYGASDVAADANHTHEAASAAAAVLPAQLCVRVSSLGRARSLADQLCMLRPDLGAPVVDSRLNEMNFGAWEGRPWDQVPKSAFDAWTADFADHPFGGLESTQQVIERVAAGLADTCATGASEALWVTHAGVIRAVSYLLLHWAERIKDARQWPADAPAPGGLVCLDLGSAAFQG